MKLIILFSLFCIFVAGCAQQHSVEDQVKDDLALKLGINETPEITMITNITKLVETQPAIYKGAENGDYVVKYSNRLVVYDFTNKKIIRQFNFQEIRMG